MPFSTFLRLLAQSDDGMISLGLNLKHWLPLAPCGVGSYLIVFPWTEFPYDKRKKETSHF
jgi:hypothetical protein